MLSEDVLIPAVESRHIYNVLFVFDLLLANSIQFQNIFSIINVEIKSYIFFCIFTSLLESKYSK